MDNLPHLYEIWAVLPFMKDQIFGTLIWLLVVGGITAPPICTILRKAGFSGWWTVLFFVPVAGIFVLWVIAYSPWPVFERSAERKPDRIGTSP